jgi:hypothetical protein
MMVVFTYFIGLCQRIDGITMVATPQPIKSDAFDRVKLTNAEWVSFVPYGFQRKNENVVKFDLENQWWGETKAGLETCIDLAHKAGLKVMLKPQIYIPGNWSGDIDYTTENDWTIWEASYSKYIMAMVDIALKNKVDMFCIGTELKISCVKRKKFWETLISTIRSKYDGKLTYSANWDDYSTVPFWPKLDFIGISAYFPLTDMKEPTINTLLLKWKKNIYTLANFSEKYDKKILFTEYGYLTTDQCAWKTWQVEQNIATLNENQQAQANAFEALYKSLWSQKFMAGGFIWKWFPNGLGHEGYKHKDYDPQDKKAEEVVKKYYK